MSRHLDESQRAMVAAELAQWSLGDNQHTGSENLPTLYELTKLDDSQFIEGVESISPPKKTSPDPGKFPMRDAEKRAPLILPTPNG